jgi:hypothetical protein
VFGNVLRSRGFAVETCSMDAGYDHEFVHAACHASGVKPIIPIRKVNAGDKYPRDTRTKCEHGTWTFAGADFKRNATKWRCPTGKCEPKSEWRKATRYNPLVPRTTKRWDELYRGRAAIEREFGRLKHEYGLAPLRIRGLERVQLHADLTMLARLSLALSRARAVPLAA